jgi:hypothetical protein
MTKSDKVYAALRKHIQSFFAGHSYAEEVWTLGPAPDVFPRLRVGRLSPGPRTGLWVYATLGAWEARMEPLLEFLVTAPASDIRHVELLTMVVYYHRSQGLGLGHTLPIGEPWLEGSACDGLLVSRPYPFGSDLEVCDLGKQQLHFVWLLPITSAERAFKVENGLEALEQRFENCGLEYWKPERDSVV